MLHAFQLKLKWHKKTVVAGNRNTFGKTATCLKCRGTEILLLTVLFYIHIWMYLCSYACALTHVLLSQPCHFSASLTLHCLNTHFKCTYRLFSSKLFSMRALWGSHFSLLQYLYLLLLLSWLRLPIFTLLLYCNAVAAHWKF